MKSYKEFNELLIGRNSKQKKLANNTYAIRNEDGTIAIRLHETNIIAFHPNGRIVFNTGGWKTPTTKDRLNQFAPISISQKNGVWHISQAPVWNDETKEMTWFDSVIFQDGMSFYRGHFKGYAKDEKKEQKLRKQIRDYSKLVVNSLPLPMPSGGDCWHCGMREEKTGKPLGELVKGNDHLISHIKEKYIVPSLVWHALESAGCNPQGNGCAWFDVAFGNSNLGKNNHIGSFVKRYLYKQFGLAR